MIYFQIYEICIRWKFKIKNIKNYCKMEISVLGLMLPFSNIETYIWNMPYNCIQTKEGY